MSSWNADFCSVMLPAGGGPACILYAPLVAYAYTLLFPDSSRIRVYKGIQTHNFWWKILVNSELSQTVYSIVTDNFVFANSHNMYVHTKVIFYWTMTTIKQETLTFLPIESSGQNIANLPKWNKYGLIHGCPWDLVMSQKVLNQCCQFYSVLYRTALSLTPEIWKDENPLCFWLRKSPEIKLCQKFELGKLHMLNIL